MYLAVPPSVVPATLGGLRVAGLTAGARIVLEKPFGRDLASARQLNRELHETFDESQIFRIDHYLGKETVQNILVFRFGNSVFERVWNRDAIDHMQITVAEAIGVEGRGSFYEETGALRDIVQNHVLQVLSLLTMEPPSSLAAEAIRDEKAKVLRAMRPLDPAGTIRGQYAAGTIDGEAVPAYREDPGVAPASTTETYFAAQLEIDSWRWAGVPIFIRTGKRLARRTKQAGLEPQIRPVTAAAGAQSEAERRRTFQGRLDYAPRAFHAVLAGEQGVVGPLTRWGPSCRPDQTAEAYERLLRDAMGGHNHVP